MKLGPINLGSNEYLTMLQHIDDLEDEKEMLRAELQEWLRVAENMARRQNNWMREYGDLERHTIPLLARTKPVMEDDAGCDVCGTGDRQPGSTKCFDCIEEDD